MSHEDWQTVNETFGYENSFYLGFPPPPKKKPSPRTPNLRLFQDSPQRLQGVLGERRSETIRERGSPFPTISFKSCQCLPWGLRMA